MKNDILYKDASGLYCPAGGFHIDPWQQVPRALITHAHGDHARAGSDKYLCAKPGFHPLRLRVGDRVESVPYGEKLTIGDAIVSFHPAGHVLGSAQIRVEVGGEVWVVSGDYKRDSDPTCEPFEVIPCNTFITESTFGLPIYRWQAPAMVFEQIISWWQENSHQSRPSILLSYVMGKTQRLLASFALASDLPGELFCHGAMQQMNGAYRQSGVNLSDAPNPLDLGRDHSFGSSLILAPPSVLTTSWLNRFNGAAIGRVSGWMQVRGRRRRTTVDRGFVLSDHADWPALMDTISSTGAERVLVTHGYLEVMVRYLKEQGLDASPLPLSPWDQEEQ